MDARGKNLIYFIYYEKSAYGHVINKYWDFVVQDMYYSRIYIV